MVGQGHGFVGHDAQRAQAAEKAFGLGNGGQGGGFARFQTACIEGFAGVGKAVDCACLYG